ncbi:Cdc15p [Rhizophagus irregularis DAOM 197198w]|uniref:Cdc15p n=1 Tax=Rhizophagus irregularis (strain DAOM 197198w) TaxID=1432141 RepID=A0A015KW43_RHIIW|nr:Cdc15p [Rhizophagus irregularis DAOM 197198w]
MSNNIELNFIDNSNEWINWIEESITKKQIKYYDYKHFNNVQEIGFGEIGKVYRANWKNSHSYLALKSFFNFNIVAKEIANEFKLQREADFHENIIHFHGITTEIQSNNSKKYLLVMEYANSGTLRNYLSECFENLTWNDKLNLALQLANAISFLHDNEIVHHDLVGFTLIKLGRKIHSNNILVHKNTIKLTDFGLSKRIKESSNIQSKSFEMVVYIDPQNFDVKGDSNKQIQVYSLNKKSNIYSIGILLWEISSGYPPFCNKPYNIDLAMEILYGLREKPIPNTREDYAKIYTDCWNNEQDNRPTINQVIAKLNAIILDFQQNHYNADFQLSRVQLSKSNNEISEDIIIQNFNRINIKEIEPLIFLNLIINDYDLLVNEIILLIEDVEIIMRKIIIVKYLNDHDIALKEIYNWLLNNQDNSNSVFILGVFYHFGIEINVNRQKAFELYQNAVKSGNVFGITSLGYCHEEGIGTGVDKQKAFELYQKAANLGNPRGIRNLGYCYEFGIGASIDELMAFELYQKSTNLGNTLGINNLGCCYYGGIGIIVDKQKSFDLFQKGANSGNYLAQYNLASMYESGKKKDISQAIYWYEKSAEQGYPYAQNRLSHLINDG